MACAGKSPGMPGLAAGWNGVTTWYLGISAGLAASGDAAARERKVRLSTGLSLQQDAMTGNGTAPHSAGAEARRRLKESMRLVSGERLAGSRLAIVAAHPDDETIGAGAYLARLSQAIFIHVTDGAPRDMRDARSEEHTS